MAWAMDCVSDAACATSFTSTSASTSATAAAEALGEARPGVGPGVGPEGGWRGLGAEVRKPRGGPKEEQEWMGDASNSTVRSDRAVNSYHCRERGAGK